MRGTGNVEGDPLFFDDGDPDGADDLYGTADDGLRLLPASPCVDTADPAVATETDLVGTTRPAGEAAPTWAATKRFPRPAGAKGSPTGRPVAQKAQSIRAFCRCMGRMNTRKIVSCSRSIALGLALGLPGMLDASAFDGGRNATAGSISDALDRYVQRLAERPHRPPPRAQGPGHGGGGEGPPALPRPGRSARPAPRGTGGLPAPLRGDHGQGERARRLRPASVHDQEAPPGHRAPWPPCSPAMPAA